MDKKYWKFFDELKNPQKTKKLKLTEFSKETTSEFNVENLYGLSRRKFMALTAASLAFATTACKDYRDKGVIVPYNQKPENTLPGKANYYASTCTGCSNHCGLLIKTREGRPIKVDGNPEHPSNKGKICPIGQARILNLYHPERYKKYFAKRNNVWQEIDFAAFFSDFVLALNSAQQQGKEIAIISKPIYSPSFARILEDFQKKYPTAKIYTYEFLQPYPKDLAWENFYPGSEKFDYDLSQASLIVSFDSNFLATEGNFVQNIRSFVSNRNVNKLDNFNKFYAFESDLTLTGANADHRIPIHPNLHIPLLSSIINEILVKHEGKLLNKDLPLSLLKEKFSKFNLDALAKDNNLNYNLLQRLVYDLVQNQGKSAIITGDILPYDAHVLGFLLNEILNNSSNFKFKSKAIIAQSKLEDFLSLTNTIKNGNVGAVIVLSCNPVFHFPLDIGFKESLSKVPFVISLLESENETANYSTHIAPISHNFESWGDFFDGYSTYSLAQPVIEPIFSTYQMESIILYAVEGKMSNDNYHKYLMRYWEKEIYPKTNSAVAFEQFWFSVLHDGVLVLNESQLTKPKPDFSVVQKINIKSFEKTWTLSVRKPYFILDGEYLNNGWLLEIPHPISKVTWDNYIAISEKDANSLNLKTGDIVQIDYQNKFLEAPVFIIPGVAEHSLSIEAGFGRENAGIIGEKVGFNPMVLLSKGIEYNGYTLDNVKITKLHRTYKIASTVEHHSLNDTFLKDLHKSRGIIQEGTVEGFLKNKFEIHRHRDNISIIPEIKYTGVKWAMAIDLNKCIGCGACIASCNVENNVPVVGKDQVLRGREMHWIRIDTYFSGSPDNPEVSLQPMLCQHCDDAPCENVCPVVATNHSPDGLNQMVYNRCVGTRYCSNNCPYKVRRFNFYDFRNHFANGFFYRDTLKLLNNPEVTVRSRGVMEKCTFCIQRITEARHNALSEGRELKGSEVKTACQEACPAEAIIFGDMHDPNSEVSFWRNHKLGYYVFEELNIKPNVTYIAKLRNKKEEGLS